MMKAYRDYGSKFVYTYSLVGADDKLIANIDHSDQSFKEKALLFQRSEFLAFSHEGVVPYQTTGKTQDFQGLG